MFDPWSEQSQLPALTNITKYRKKKWRLFIEFSFICSKNRILKQALQYQKDEGTQDDRGRDGGTNFILRIKEQETRLTLREHDDDDDDDDFYLPQ